MTHPGQLAYLTETGWMDTPVPRPSVVGNIQCDVAVIGGGLCGMVASLQLAQYGADVVLIDADIAGGGASSRNAGFLTSAVATDPQLVATLHRRRLPALVQVAENAVNFTERLIRSWAIDCDFEPTGVVRAAMSPPQLQRACRSVNILRNAGARVDFVEGRDLGLPDTVIGGLRELAGGVLNPGKLVMGLRNAAVTAGVRLFEEAPARAIVDSGAAVSVHLPGGKVRAQQVLLAANAHSRELSIVPRNLVRPVWVTLVETCSVAPERIAATGWTSRVPIATQHMLLENYRLSSPQTILFGTRRVQTTYQPLDRRSPSRAVVADILNGFHETFPSLRDVLPRRTWGGWIGMTSSSLPVAGEASPRVLYAIGCNGHGLAQAPYLGSLLADRLAGKGSSEDLQEIWRANPRFVPNPICPLTLRLAWTVDRLADRRGRRTSRR